MIFLRHNVAGNDEELYIQYERRNQIYSTAGIVWYPYYPQSYFIRNGTLSHFSLL